MPSPRPSLAAHLFVWLLVPAIEIYLAQAGAMRHAGWQYAVEVAAFAGLGFAQWRFAASHWLGSLLCPGFLVLLVALSMRAPADLIARLFYVLGAVLLTTSFLKGKPSPSRASVPVAALVAVLATLGAWCLGLMQQTQDANQRFGNQLTSLGDLMLEQLAWPARRQAQPSEAATGPSLILVTLDTLRVDAAAEMESFAWLSERGRSFGHAASTSSWTLPAVASLQTGLLPSDHGATCLYDSHCQGLNESVTTLAEALTERGYRTAAFTANPWISSSTGLARGYANFEDFASLMPFRLVFGLRPVGPHPQDASVLIDAALAWLDEGPEEPFLLWVHLIDPHMPYLQTPGLDAINVRSLRGGGPASAEVREAIREAYAREVAHADAEIMRLLRALEARAFFERGTLVFTSDHGEELWDHGGIEHGHSHHGEVVDVPLVIVSPGLSPGPGPGVASLMDVTPTLLAVAGVEPAGFDLRERLPDDRIALAHGAMVGPLLRSARDERLRAIVRGDPDLESVTTRVYDLSTDPGELAPLIGADDGPTARAARALRGPNRGEAAQPNKEALRALGYVE